MSWILAQAGPAAHAAASTPKPAIAWWLYALIAGVVVVAGAVVLLLALRRSRQPPEELCDNCGRALMPDWPRCLFCKTPRGFKRAALQFISGPLSGRKILLEEDVTTLGSAAGSTVVLADTGVSRKHAGIRKAEGGFELADLGSTNGVYVNGEKVARRRLQVGDVIRVGTSEMVFKG